MDRDLQVGQVITKDRIKRYIKAALPVLSAASAWIGAYLYFYWNLGNDRVWVRLVKLGLITAALGAAAFFGSRWAWNA